jgi:putative transposase
MTTAGPLALKRLRLRTASRLGFASEIVGKGVVRTHALEALVLCSFLRGLCWRRLGGAGGDLRRASGEVGGRAGLAGGSRSR